MAGTFTPEEAERIARADAALEALRGLRIDGPPPGATLDPKAINQLLAAQLRAAVDAHRALLDAAGHREDEPAALRIALLWRIAEGCRSMADALRRSWIPSYLTDDQEENYRMALADKATPLDQRRRAALAQVVALAGKLPEHPSAPAATIVAGRLAREPGAVLRMPTRCGQREDERPPRAKEPWRWEKVAEALLEAQDRLPACVSAEDRAVFAEVARQVDEVVAARDISMLGDMEIFVREMVEQVATCSGTVPFDFPAIPPAYAHGARLPRPTGWAPPPLTTPEDGPVRTPTDFSLRLGAIDEWRTAWAESLLPPFGLEGSAPNDGDLYLWGQRAAERVAVVDRLETDATALLEDPLHGAAVHLALAAAWLAAADDLLATAGPRAYPADAWWLALAATAALERGESLTDRWILPAGAPPPSTPAQRARAAALQEAFSARTAVVRERTARALKACGGPRRP